MSAITIMEETSMSAHEVIDPVCGMTIAADGEITREYERAVYHFCSEGCAVRFDADAIAYVAASRLGLDGWGKTPAPGFLRRHDSAPPRTEA